MFTTTACRVVSAEPEQKSSRVVNVKAFGARGDGAGDDTAAIQAAINAAKPGETIYFPAGVYSVANFVVKNRSGLSFSGEGQKSTIKQRSGAARIATVEASRDIAISNLAFDANGIVSYGGVVFYAAKGVRIENNTFFDSAAKPIGNTDRYSFVFARGSEPSQDIKIVNNSIDDLQLEVNHSQRVLIDRNRVRRAIATAGIGIFTVGDKAIAEDYQITNNTVIDPPGAGFSVGIDPPTDNHCIFRRIAIADNQITRTKTAGYGIRVGTPDNSKKTTGNVFENIQIKNNRIRIESSAPQQLQLIISNTSASAGIGFDRLIVTGNTLESDGPQNRGYAIDLRRIQNSVIANNSLKGVSNGISLAGDLVANEMRNNVVTVSDVAYAITGSLGKNRAANNRALGSPKQGWSLSTPNASDSIEQ
jgi:polygalacturonase